MNFVSPDVACNDCEATNDDRRRRELFNMFQSFPTSEDEMSKVNPCFPQKCKEIGTILTTSNVRAKGEKSAELNGCITKDGAPVASGICPVQRRAFPFQSFEKQDMHASLVLEKGGLGTRSTIFPLEYMRGVQTRREKKLNLVRVLKKASDIAADYNFRDGCHLTASVRGCCGLSDDDSKSVQKGKQQRRLRRDAVSGARACFEEGSFDNGEEKNDDLEEPCWTKNLLQQGEENTIREPLF